MVPTHVARHWITISLQVFFILFGVSMLCFFYPEHLYTEYGPIKERLFHIS